MTHSPARPGPTRHLAAWILAGWLGALAGLLDAMATMPLTTGLSVLPAALTVYTAVALLLFGLGLLLGRLLDHLLAHRGAAWRRPRAILTLAGTSGRSSFALGFVAAALALFFALHATATSSLPLLHGRFGPLARLAFATLDAVAAFLAIARLWHHHARGSAHSPWWAITTIALLLLAFPAASLPVLLRDGRAPEAGNDRPRALVLVWFDGLPAERLTTSGNRRPSTPNLDELARSGMRFTRAYVEQPATGPGLACLLTGLPPLANGAMADSQALDRNVLTVAERLHMLGYQTAGFANGAPLDARFTLAQGFATYADQDRLARLSLCEPHLMLRGLGLFQAWLPLRNRTDTTAGTQTDASLELCLSWLRHRPPGSFFVFVHLRPDEALADRELGRLIAELKRLRLLDSTLLAITARHGEALEENGPATDHGCARASDLHVPLVLHLPGVVPAGSTVQRPVPVTALVPTAFALLKEPYPPQTDVRFYAPLIGQAVTPPPQTVMPDSPPVYAITGRRGHDCATVVGDRYKVDVQEGRIVGLYDLASDRGERNNLWPDLTAAGTRQQLQRQVRLMSGELRDWLLLCREHAVGGPWPGL